MSYLTPDQIEATYVIESPRFDPFQGTESLVYIVYNGVDQYDDDGKHMRKFTDPDAAHDYAEVIHRRYRTADIVIY